MPGMRNINLALMCLFAWAPQSLHSKGREPAAGGPSKLSGWVVYWDRGKSLQAAMEHGKDMEEISIFAADFDDACGLTVYSEVTAAIDALKKTQRFGSPRILLSVVNDVKKPGGSILKDPDCIHTILSSEEKTSAHIDQLMRLSAGTDGIEIDYESLYLKDRDAFSNFIRELAGRLHGRGQWLSVDVEPKLSDVLKDREGAMDWKALGTYADNVKVMAYLFHYPSGDPGPLAPPAWVAQIARFALTQIPADKLSMALTMSGCDWGRPGIGSSINHEKAMALAATHRTAPRRDADSASPNFEYRAGGVTHQVWYEDAESLGEKVRVLKEEGVLHIALWHLGAGDPDFLKEVTQP